MSTAVLFPGQGSQAKGMGGDLFERFADWTSEADALLGYSIRELCHDDPDSTLGHTAFTQPALYVVNALSYRARTDDGAEPPRFLAGHSLGEYNALLAAGVFDFATGLRLVKQRGALMGRVSGGGMTAVVGLAPEKIEAVLASSHEGQRVDVANFNGFDQTVIAGPVADLQSIESAFVDAGARAYIPLKVSAPFHSRYMREAAQEFAGVIAGEAGRFQPPSVPVVSNVTARPYDATAVADTLGRQIDHAVRWLDSMVFLLDAGVETFEEVGPGTVLAKLMAKIRRARR